MGKITAWRYRVKYKYAGSDKAYFEIDGTHKEFLAALTAVFTDENAVEHMEITRLGGPYSRRI